MASPVEKDETRDSADLLDLLTISEEEDSDFDSDSDEGMSGGVH